MLTSNYVPKASLFDDSVGLVLQRAIQSAAIAAIVTSRNSDTPAFLTYQTKEQPLSLCVNVANNRYIVPKINTLEGIINWDIREAISKSLHTDSANVNIRGSLIISRKSEEIPIQQTFTVDFRDYDEKSSDDTLHLAANVVTTSSTTSFPATTTTSAGSKRKSYQPIKYCLPEDLPPIAAHSPHSLSGCASPSADSGALDLSRAASMTDSAPMTPLKECSTSPQQANTETSENSWKLVASEEQNNVPGKISRRRTTALTSRSSMGFLTSGRRSNTLRRFPCNQCREEFPCLNALEKHTLALHGAYRCHVCQAEFTQRSNLQRHALKHVGFKPFECRVCSRAYYRKDHLMRHMEMGHPGFAPRENITVHLNSSESLDFLNRGHITAEPMVQDPISENLLSTANFEINVQVDQ